LQIAFFVIFLKILQLIKCELPPPPSSFYRPPSNGRPFMPTIPPMDSYGPPPPAMPSNSYGLPAEYGPPMETETPAPIIHKHVYIHIPPPEPEYVEMPNDPVQPVQKHYRIIFIKAPTMAAPIAQVPAIQAVNEEKTIVYVLVKKPDNVREVLPAPQTTLPSKPEVYFIRYKTEEKTTMTPEIESGVYYKK
jgi:Domain of unknown function (DUF243)